MSDPQTSGKRVAVATAAEFPELDDDGPALLGALRDRGLVAEPAVWTDETVDWSSYDIVVVRSTWDYAPRRTEFLAWARRVESVSRLANPADVLEWNTDKVYLRALAEAGLPVVPTDWLEPGDRFVPPVQGDYVVKPSVSAGSKDTDRFRAGDHDEHAVALVQAIHASGRTVMVQPYLHGLDEAGETAQLFIGGVYSHAIRKAPLLHTHVMGEESGLYRPETITAREPSAGERETAERVLDTLASVAPAARGDLVYARVDLVPGTDGELVVLELELTEPSMFLVNDGADGRTAGAKLAAAIEAALP